MAQTAVTIIMGTTLLLPNITRHMNITRLMDITQNTVTDIIPSTVTGAVEPAVRHRQDQLRLDPLDLPQRLQLLGRLRLDPLDRLLLAVCDFTLDV